MPEKLSGPFEGVEKAWMAGLPIAPGAAVVIWWLLARYELMELAPPEMLVVAAFTGIIGGAVSAFGAYMARNTTPEIKEAARRDAEGV